MAELVPLKAVYDGSSICGLSELRDGDVVGVEHGGLGVCTLASNTLLIGNGQGAISTTSAMTTNGQIIIAGSSGPQLTNLTGTSNEIEIADGDGAITIGLPSTVQISTNLKTPAFSITDQYCLPIADGSAGQIMCTDGSGALTFIDFDGTGHCIAEDGTTVADRTCLNFTGGGVTVTDNSVTNATDISIPVTTPELKVRNTSGVELSIELPNTAIGGELICDTTPQLGGTLDVNGYGITSVSNGNISITPNGTGSLVLDGLSWPQADGTSGYILCTDGGGNLAWAADAAGGSAAGSNNELQYNSSGSFGASSNLTFDGSTLAVTGGMALVVGHTAPIQTPILPNAQVVGTDNDTATLQLSRFSADAHGPIIATVKSRNATIGGNTIVQDGDSIMRIYGYVADGTDMISNAGKIALEIDGTPGANDTPGRWVFSTTANGATDNTERMRISSAGDVTMSSAGVGWSKASTITSSTTWTDTAITMRNKAQLVMWYSNGTGGNKEYGILFCSGNDQGGHTYFRNVITVISSNSSGYYGYANLSFREKPDSGNASGVILQARRASNAEPGGCAFFKMHVASSGD